MDLALRLKDLGFDEPCFTFYNGKFIEFKIWDDDGATYPQINVDMDIGKCISAPTFSQAFRFFREKYGLFAEITLWGDGLGYTSMIKEIKQEEFIEVYQRAIVDTGLPIWKYEKAELACLKKILEIVENIK